jgi:hypothetical protein
MLFLLAVEIGLKIHLQYLPYLCRERSKPILIRNQHVWLHHHPSHTRQRHQLVVPNDGLSLSPNFDPLLSVFFACLIYDI